MVELNGSDSGLSSQLSTECSQLQAVPIHEDQRSQTPSALRAFAPLRLILTTQSLAILAQFQDHTIGIEEVAE